MSEWAFVAPSDCGLGCFARTWLRAGQVVGEYGGPRLRDARVDSHQAAGSFLLQVLAHRARTPHTHIARTADTRRTRTARTAHVRPLLLHCLLQIPVLPCVLQIPLLPCLLQIPQTAVVIDGDYENSPFGGARSAFGARDGRYVVIFANHDGRHRQQGHAA